MAARFFKIDRRPIIPGGWGDYGDILQHGMAFHDPELRGKLALQRTGPYIPPITLPGIGNIVLTAEAKNLLESSNLSGFTLAPVEKALIVELPWETWNLEAEDPPVFPETGEPEDYILRKSHSPAAARALGELWEVVVPNTVEILRPSRVVNSHRELRIDLSTWNGADLIRGSGYGSVLFSERARDWFTENWASYVEFDDFPTT